MILLVVSGLTPAACLATAQVEPIPLPLPDPAKNRSQSGEETIIADETIMLLDEEDPQPTPADPREAPSELETAPATSGRNPTAEAPKPRIPSHSSAPISAAPTPKTPALLQIAAPTNEVLSPVPHPQAIVPQPATASPLRRSQFATVSPPVRPTPPAIVYEQIDRFGRTRRIVVVQATSSLANGGTDRVVPARRATYLETIPPGSGRIAGYRPLSPIGRAAFGVEVTAPGGPTIVAVPMPIPAEPAFVPGRPVRNAVRSLRGGW